MPTRRDAATVSHLFSAAAAAGPADPTPRTPSKSDSSPRAHNSKHSRSTRLMAMMATTLAGGGPGSAGSLEARKWAALVATIWIQAFTGTNFDFSAYSSDLKSVLGVSQVQLNYLAVASDLGKAVGWSSGLALLCLPLPVVLFAAAGMGLAGYGLQWLVITGRVSLPYFSWPPICLVVKELESYNPLDQQSRPLSAACQFFSSAGKIQHGRWESCLSLSLSLSLSLGGAVAALTPGIISGSRAERDLLGSGGRDPLRWSVSGYGGWVHSPSMILPHRTAVMRRTAQV